MLAYLFFMTLHAIEPCKCGKPGDLMVIICWRRVNLRQEVKGLIET